MLRAVLPFGVVGDSIVGDVREEYAHYVASGGRAPRAWYWLHAMRLAGGYLMTRGRGVEMGTFLKDLKSGARSLLRMPGSAAISVVVLAIGIGLCTFMFSLVYGIYFRGLDLPEADRVLVLYQTNYEEDQDELWVPIQDLADWRAAQTSFEGLSGMYSGTVNISAADEPVRFSGAFVTANLFEILRVQPLIGRGFEAGDDDPDAPLNVVLGYDAWQEQFAGDPSVIGRDVRVNGEPSTILGVMPAGFGFPQDAQVWVPFRDDPLATARRQGRSALVYGRLQDGVTRDQATSEMVAIAQRLEEEYPETNEGIGAQVLTPIEANMDPQIDMIFAAMMFAVICVLLVACANVASLLLARATMRTKEAGVRIAMGGNRLRVMIPFFAEALVLASAGAAIGIGIAYVCVDWFDAATVADRPWFMEFQVDFPILLFVVGVTFLTALVAGILPAVQVSRTDVSSVLKDESRGSSGLRIGRVSRALVTAEVALSCALLIGAGLMTKSMIEVGKVEYPFETEGLFTARVGIFEADYPDRESRQRLWSDLTSELAGLSQLSAVALTTNLPYNGTNSRRIAFEGVEYPELNDYPIVGSATVTPGYFAALGSAITSGRDFVAQDDLESELVVIVNQPMVDRFFDGKDPIGLRFREGASDTLPMYTVVGVVPDLHMHSGQPPGTPGYQPAGYYRALGQSDASFLSIAALSSSGNALAVTADVRSALRRLDSDMPIYDVMQQSEVVEARMWFYRAFGTVFVVFGLSALFMASVGLYGVLSFAVGRRTSEMGIRMALGAGAPDVVRLVARQGASQLALGLGIGLLLALGVTRVIGILMFNVDPQDPWVFGGVVALIVTVGMAASIFPARRATNVDPVEALRSE
jgi:predicted permease